MTTLLCPRACSMTRLCVLALALTACGDDDSPQPGAESGSTGMAAADETGAAESNGQPGSEATSEGADGSTSDAEDATTTDEPGTSSGGEQEIELVVDARYDDGEDGAPCEQFDEPFLSVRDSTMAFEGDASCRISVNEGNQGWGNLGGTIVDAIGELGLGDEIWIRMSLYVPSDYQSNLGRSKFIRLRTFDTEDQSHGYLDWYLRGNYDAEETHWWIYEGTQRWSTTGVAADDVQRDTWETYEVYYRLDNVPTSEGGSALVRLWKNGVPLGEFTDQATLVLPDDIARGLLIFSYYGNEGSPRDQHMWIDKLQVATVEPPNRDENGNPFIGL